MTVRTAFPHRVETLDHVWVPLSDGCRLSARIWLPDNAHEQPVPAILEYIPYRKNDGTVTSDAIRFPYFAGHGYAGVRVDLRGSGDSEGILRDEYLPREQEDALEVLAWLEQQSWCSGSIGMMGYSWGGFAALQVAARRPRQLKAIVTVNSSDDRYRTDVHYIGGSVLAYDMLSWATTLLALNGRPPDPLVVGEEWRELWHTRLEALEPLIATWLSHQLRDDYWRHGSVNEDHAVIQCPVLAVGGWADPYRDAVLRLLSSLSCPRRGIIGPWAHGYPHEALPGPQIGFLQECLRWWDHWLKDVDTDVMNEPLLRAFILDSPDTEGQAKSPPTERRGRWVGAEQWPAGELQRPFYPADGRLVDQPTRSPPRKLRGVETCGLAAGVWCPYQAHAALTPDQRPDDASSLTFTSAPLSEPLELLGFPELELELAVDRPLALIAARLCDVSPTGASSLITRGILNLTHRDSHNAPSMITPGASMNVRLIMNSVGYRLAAGHSLRLAISPTYWPWTWPSPRPVVLTLITDKTSLLLPERLPNTAAAVAFPPAESAPPLDVEVLEAANGARQITHDVRTGRTELRIEPDYLTGRRRVQPSGLEPEEWGHDAYTIVGDDPLSASVHCRREVGIGRSSWRTRVEVESTMTCDAEHFYVKTTLAAFEGAESVFSHEWTSAIPRSFG